MNADRDHVFDGTGVCRACGQCDDPLCCDADGTICYGDPDDAE